MELTVHEAMKVQSVLARSGVVNVTIHEVQEVARDWRAPEMGDVYVQCALLGLNKTQAHVNGGNA